MAIRKKKPLFSKVEWTREQKQEFEAFWRDNYGKPIKPWWHQLYESMNGVYHFDYFPEMLYSTRLEPLLNPPDYCRVFSDKSLTETIYGNVRDVAFPETILMNCNGAFLTGNRQLLNERDAIALLRDAGECIMKPTVETGSGKGVRFLLLQDGTDTASHCSIKQILDDGGKDFVIQRVLKNSAALSAINPYALNTFRVITYLVNGEIHVMPLSLRIGIDKNRVDNIHRGGLVVGVNADGTLKKTAYQLGYGDRSTTFETHPDTGVTFEGLRIGDVQRMTETAQKLHAATPQLGIISWDLTFDEAERVVLIEANCQGQSIWFPQIVNAEPAFGEDTEFVLKYIKG